MKSNILKRCIPFTLLFLILVSCTTNNPGTPEPSATLTIAASSTPLAAPTDTATPAYLPPPSFTWRSLSPKDAHINALVIDPSNPAILYAGGDRMIHKSIDGGESWTICYSVESTGQKTVMRMVIDPLTPSTLYAGVNNLGIIKSEDAGKTWHTMNSGFTGSSFRTINIDPLQPNVLYAGTAEGLFKTRDGGTNWHLISDRLRDSNIFAFAFTPQDSSIVYVGLGKIIGAYKSIDSSATWININEGLKIPTGARNEPPTWVNAIAVDPSDPDTLYAAGYGLYKSVTGGENWEPINNDLETYDDGTQRTMDYLTIDARHPEILYAVERGTDVFRSVDGGQSWMNITNRAFRPYSPIAIDPANADILYIGSPNGVYTTRVEVLPTSGPTPAPPDCSNGWTQLKIGAYAIVSEDENDTPNRVRETYDSQSEITALLDPGEIVKIVDGPYCVDNLVFWQVANLNIPGGTGWTAEGDFSQYWLTPYNAQ